MVSDFALVLVVERQRGVVWALAPLVVVGIEPYILIFAVGVLKFGRYAAFDDVSVAISAASPSVACVYQSLRHESHGVGEALCLVGVDVVDDNLVSSLDNLHIHRLEVAR